jgi:predicted nucleic acid-binding protein
MKFRLLFIVFNLVIFASFALIFLMPAFVLGWEYAGVFWSTNWPVAAAFLLVLGALNAYFVYNWKVFSLLEQERWEELIEHLERAAFQQKRLTRARAQILINAYVVAGQVDRIRKLERFLRDEKPRLVARLAVQLGIPYLLSQDADSMLAYFADVKEMEGVAQPYWVRWCYAFALMTAGRFDDARPQLVAVLHECRDPLLRSLTAHMLEPFAGGDRELRTTVEDARLRLRDKYTRERLDRELERQRQNLQVLFLSPRIEEARDWVFKS